MLARTTVATLLATALAVPLTATPVAAETRAFRDRAGDVSHSMDIHRVTVKNGDRLVVTLKHRAVRERDFGTSGVYIDVTPRRTASPTYYIESGVGNHYDLFWMDGWRVGGRLGCPGPGDYRASYSPRTDTTRFSLARSCLNGASFRATRLRVSAVSWVGRGRKDWAPGYRNYYNWVGLR